MYGLFILEGIKMMIGAALGIAIGQSLSDKKNPKPKDSGQEGKEE